MDFTILVRVGMVLAAVGLFVASYYRFSNPVRLDFARERRAPQLPGAGAEAAESAAGERRSPWV